MKKGVGLLLLILMVLFLAGCNKKESVNLKVKCEEDIIEETYKVGDTISCSLLGDNYDLDVTKITNNEVEVESKRDGLVEPNENGTINMTKKVRKFIAKNGKKLVLALQVTDAGNIIEIEWNE